MDYLREARWTLTKNRKQAESYRFNGHPFFDAGSIHAVTIPELESRIIELEAKLADPDDHDDKRWTKRWLSRSERELAKKRKGLVLKARELRPKRRRT